MFTMRSPLGEEEGRMGKDLEMGARLGKKLGEMTWHDVACFFSIRKA